MSSMETIIRKATGKDYQALCELFDQVDALHRDNLPHLFQKPPGPARDYDYYHEQISNEQVCLYVADVGGKLLGYVHALIRDTPPIPVMVPRQYAIVDSIGVRAEFQNRGIGRLLMDAVHEWALARGATSIELNVYEFNQEAITFYQKLGYHTYSRRMSKALNRDDSG